jgi:hypothetical protein
VPPCGHDLRVLEVNGAVDFTRLYRRDADIFEAAVGALMEPLQAAITA